MASKKDEKETVKKVGAKTTKAKTTTKPKSKDDTKVKVVDKKEHGGAREGSGRKEFVPTPEQLARAADLAGFGVPQQQIASDLGIHKNTLLRHFREALDEGMAIANAKIGKTLFQKAIGGDTTALIFWAKTRMGFREKQELDVTTNGESLNSGPSRADILNALRERHK